MKDQVLSIEQMRELIRMGVDTSKASMFWHPAFYRCNGILDYDRYEDIPTIKLQNNYNLDYDVLAFTLQDILDMLPKVITTENDNFELYLNTFQCYAQYRDPKHNKSLNVEYSDSILETTFNMLKWCKQNNYI